MRGVSRRFVVAVLAGPSDTEQRRVLDLLASLCAHEPDLATSVVVVDDAPPREWPVDSIPNPRRGRGIGTLGGTCAGTLAALRWARSHAPEAHVVRLDSDALVIAPFTQRVTIPPGAGIVGSCRCTPDGTVRDTTWWAETVRSHARPLWVWKRPPLRGRHVMRPDPLARTLARSAPEPGLHCMAAGCIITAPFVTALDQRGWLDRPQRWLRTFYGDDILLGAMAQALGFALVDDHAVFGLKHQGLLDTPQALQDRGFAIIHSLKGDGEEPARAFFRAARA